VTTEDDERNPTGYRWIWNLGLRAAWALSDKCEEERGKSNHLHPATATARIMSDLKAFKRALLLVAASYRSIIPIVPSNNVVSVPLGALKTADLRLGYSCFQ